MSTNTPHPIPTAVQAAIHSSQHMRVVTNVLPDQQRVLLTQVTQMEMRWHEGDLRIRFGMRENKQRTTPPQPRRDIARNSARNIKRL